VLLIIVVLVLAMDPSKERHVAIIHFPSMILGNSCKEYCTWKNHLPAHQEL